MTAQDGVFDAAMVELAAGRKTSHWMWFVFPQAQSLGRSSTARFYGITSLADPHCDHQAAAQLARRAAGIARRPVAVFDYVVWGAAPPRSKLRITTRPLRAGLRAYALSAHQSQLTPMFGQGFRLAKERLRAASDTLYRRDAYG